jgi:SAM-dependent methyltransferase
MTNPSIYAAKLSNRLRRLLHNRRSMAELQTCPESEVHRIAQDIGLSVRDLSSLTCSHPGPSELMPQRLAWLRLDPAYVKLARTATYQDLQRAPPFKVLTTSAFGHVDIDTRHAPGERVVDIGCGCGTTTIELARRVSPAGYVVGVDISAPRRRTDQ